MLTSCDRTVRSHPGGALTFKSVTYHIDDCQRSGSILYANISAKDAEAGDSSGMVSCIFDSLSTDGKYIVSSSPRAEHRVTINLITGGTKKQMYMPTGNGAQTVMVKTSEGKVSVTGSDIEMVNFNDPSDSTALNFNLIQTN